MRRWLRYWAAWLVSALISAGCGQGDRSENGNQSRADAATKITAGTAEVKLAVTSDSSVGYCASVRVTNLGNSEIAGWTAVIDVHQSKISNVWSAVPTLNGTQVTVVPFYWNAHLAPGELADFGFCADKTGANYGPELVSADSTPRSEEAGQCVGGGGASGALRDQTHRAQR